MEKSKIHVLLKNYFFAEKYISQIQNEFDKNNDGFAPIMSISNKRSTEPPCGRTNTSDVKHSGGRIDVANSRTNDKIQKIVLVDRRWKVREVLEAIAWSHDSVVSILSDYLGMRKLLARWVPRLFIIDNKSNLMSTSKERLALLNCISDEILRQFIIPDEIRVQHKPSSVRNSKMLLANRHRRRLR